MNAFTGIQEFQSPTPVKSGFRIDAHDRLTIEGKAYRLIGKSGPNVVLRPAEGEELAEQFAMSNLARLSAAGKIKHEVGYYLPDDQKKVTLDGNVELLLAELPPDALKRLKTRHALVQAVKDMISEMGIRNNDDDLRAHLDEIRRRAQSYFQDHALEREMRQHDAARNGEKARRARGNKVSEAIDVPNPSTIRKMVKAYDTKGIAGLADRLTRSGNFSSYFRPEELALLTQTIRESYLTLERKSIKATTEDVKRVFKKENAQRKVDGLSSLRTPGRDAVRAHINKIDKLTVMIARYGREEAIKSLRPVSTGLQVERPLQRVEMDECKIDLMGLFASTGLKGILSPQLLEAFGLDGSKGRWWLVAAIDCRTRVFLGMKLTRDPKTSSALECLRMVLTDKGEWADAVGALTPWSQAGVPENLVTDNGAAFKAWLFNSTCMDLGISLTRTIAGMPSMRGIIERAFGTINGQLMERLSGRTFGSVAERGDHPSEKRACLDTDAQAYALVRYIVDIYHNTPHEGLGGRTPLEQWEADMEDGNFPARGFPDTRTMRLAFGTRLQRNLRKTGVTVMGVNYHSEALAAHYAMTGARALDVRWDQANLGAIEVFVDGNWYEVPAVHDRFEGVDAHTWLRARRALRARSASRRHWDEETVFKALDDIEALVAKQSLTRNLVDTTLTEKNIRNIETSLFAGFHVGGKSTTQPAGIGCGRVISPRAEETKLPQNAPQSRLAIGAAKPIEAAETLPKRKSGKASQKPSPSKPRTNLQDTRMPRMKFNTNFLQNKDKN
ncbi:Mu transposase C-terminal domain-containing protein [Acidimangrovimonas pyrenivorans]|uniref:Mu transposase C-terminal domain-containing protein n=1 Tax=Acidimangrovimonas pyrenivorans TaxID=2030798 RepID=A0ABV7ALA3_9RHOB